MSAINSTPEDNCVYVLAKYMFDNNKNLITNGMFGQLKEKFSLDWKVSASMLDKYGAVYGLKYVKKTNSTVFDRTMFEKQRKAAGKPHKIKISSPMLPLPAVTQIAKVIPSAVTSTNNPTNIVVGMSFAVVCDVEHSKRIVNELKSAEYIAMDMERYYQNIAIIQICMKKDEIPFIYIFDLVTCPDIMEIGGLKSILTSRTTTKVIHDCRADSRCLIEEFGVQMDAVFDTQVAYSIIYPAKTPIKIGLNEMLQKFVGKTNSVKKDVDHTKWRERPLSILQLQYAAEDVAFLLDVTATIIKFHAINLHQILKESMDNVSKQRATRVRVKGLAESTITPTTDKSNDWTPVSKYISFTDSCELQLSDTPFPVKACDELPSDSDDEIALLLDILPTELRWAIDEHHSLLFRATELVLDLGRKPELRHCIVGEDGSTSNSWTELDNSPTLTEQHIDDISKALKSEFSSDNRCGLSGTLHRISRKLNRSGRMIALTMRFGRMVEGSTRLITDLVKSRKSILLIGTPGVGKTTVLREIARALSSNNVKVEVVDTSNEIAGDGNITHRCIGRARRMMVPNRRLQHQVMIEAVQNHAPDCVIIDEIGTRQEARAASDITQRGVQLIGTVHGPDLKHILENPELNGFLGGVHSVVLGDEESKIRKLCTKTFRERIGPCAFKCAIEMRSMYTFAIYHNLEEAVDNLLQGKELFLDVRTYDIKSGQISQRIVKQD